MDPKPEVIRPRGYESLSHPLDDRSAKSECPAAVTKTYYLSTPKADTSSAKPEPMYIVKSEQPEGGSCDAGRYT